MTSSRADAAPANFALYSDAGPSTYVVSQAIGNLILCSGPLFAVYGQDITEP